MKEKIIPILSIIIGLLAFLLSLQYMRSLRADYQRTKNELLKSAELVNVVAAAKDIPSGVILEASDLRIKKAPRFTVSVNAVKEEQKSMLIGRKILASVSEGSPIMWDYIEGGISIIYEFSRMIPNGLRAVSIPVGGAAAVSGLIMPNDRVDILGTFSYPVPKNPQQMETVTLTILQDVTVAATGTKTAKSISISNIEQVHGYNTITVLVTPREAELLVFAQQIGGKLYISLRNPADNSFESELPIVNFDFLYKELPDLNTYRQKEIRHKR